MRGDIVQVFILCSMMAWCTYEDVVRRKISVLILLLFGIIGVILHLVFQEQSIFNLLGGMLIGALIVLLGRVSKGGIGYGDGLLLVISGVYLGLVENLQLFLLATLIASIWALFLLIILKKGRKYKIAFVPCLFAAYIIILLNG